MRRGTLTKAEAKYRASLFLEPLLEDPNITLPYYLEVRRGFILKAICLAYNEGDGGFSSPCLKKCHPDLPAQNCKHKTLFE